MILLGQRLAEKWIERQKARGKQYPITDPDLRYKFLIRVSAGLWAVALAYVALGGMDREPSGRNALGQWLLIAMATLGWIPILVFYIKRRRYGQASAVQTTETDHTPRRK